MARVTDDEIRILNNKIAGIYEELWESTGDELFRLSYEKTLRCGEVIKAKNGKGKHYNCNDPFCLRCNRRKKNENSKKTEYILQNSKKKGMKYVHVMLTKSNKEVNESNVVEKTEQMKNEVSEFVKEMKKIEKKFNVIISEEIEVKNGKFNPHFHLIMQINKRLPQKKIKEMWSKSSGGGMVIFGKNKISDEWKEKTMSYYIAKGKTDFKRKEDEDDLKLKIFALLGFYKGKKAQNGKWTGRQTLFYKGENFEKALKEYNSQGKNVEEETESKVKELERIKQKQDEIIKEQEKTIKELRMRLEQQAKVETRQEAETRAEQQETEMFEVDNTLELEEYEVANNGGYCYITRDKKKCYTNTIMAKKCDKKSYILLKELERYRDFEEFNKKFQLKKTFRENPERYNFWDRGKKGAVQVKIL